MAIWALATSATDSVAALKTGGDDTQPMGKPKKNRIRGSWPGADGRTMMGFQSPRTYVLSKCDMSLRGTPALSFPPSL